MLHVCGGMGYTRVSPSQSETVRDHMFGRARTRISRTPTIPPPSPTPNGAGGEGLIVEQKLDRLAKEMDRLARRVSALESVREGPHYECILLCITLFLLCFGILILIAF